MKKSAIVAIVAAGLCLAASDRPKHHDTVLMWCHQETSAPPLVYQGSTIYCSSSTDPDIQFNQFGAGELTQTAVGVSRLRDAGYTVRINENGTFIQATR